MALLTFSWPSGLVLSATTMPLSVISTGVVPTLAPSITVVAMPLGSPLVGDRDGLGGDATLDRLGVGHGRGLADGEVAGVGHRGDRPFGPAGRGVAGLGVEAAVDDLGEPGAGDRPGPGHLVGRVVGGVV